MIENIKLNISLYTKHSKEIQIEIYASILLDESHSGKSH